MKNKLLIFALSLFFCAPLLFSQTNKSNNDLFDFDYAQFAYDSSSNYVEFYYSLNEYGLTKHKIDGKDYVEGILHITIKDTTSDTASINKKWFLKHTVDVHDSTKKQSLIGQLAFVIAKGSYNCVIQLKDKYKDTNAKTIKDHFTIKPFSADSLALSDIQLASRIIPNSTNKKSIFYKNTFEVTPMPTALFGQNIPSVFYYFEIYDKEKTKSDKPFKLNIQVNNSKGTICYNKSQDIPRNINSRAEVGVIQINKYQTDIYTLRIAVLDSINNFGIRTTKKFFVYNPSVKATQAVSPSETKVLSSVFGIMTEEECDDVFAKSKYIATQDEKDQYKKLKGLSAKREFLYHFWNKREKNNTGWASDTYKDYMQRVAESNAKFGNTFHKGWTTDRGRVYITYGKPSEIDRYPNQENTKPYVIWHYNDIEGGVIFIFADLNGFSNYELLSSTKRGELEDNNWQSRISASR